jgi:hypothetical protein
VAAVVVTSEAAKVETVGKEAGVVNDKTSPNEVPIELDAIAQK